LKLELIPVELVDCAWLIAEPFFAAVMPHARGDFSLASLYASLACGQSRLLLAHEGVEVMGAASMRYEQRVSRRVAHVSALGGRWVANNEAWQQLSAIAKQEGADQITCVMRPAMARLVRKLGFQEAYRTYEVTL